MSSLPFGVRVRFHRQGVLYEAKAEASARYRSIVSDSLDRRSFLERRRGRLGMAPELSRAFGMAARLFDSGRNSFNTGALNYTGDVIKAMLLDTSVAATFIKPVTGATNVNPIVYSSTLNPTNNDVLVVGGVGGNLSANQTGLATASSGAAFSLNTLEGLAVAGSGAFTTNGYAVNLTQAVFVAGILGTRVGTDQTLAGKTSSRGIANATSPITWPTVPAGNTAQAVILYDAAGGSDGTNRLIAWQDGKVRVLVVKAVLAGDTTIVVQPLVGKLWDGATGSAPVISWSDSHSSTLNAAANQGDASITVTAQAAGGVALKSTADVTAFGGGLPVPTSGGDISLSIGTIYYPTSPTGLYVL